MDRALRDGYDRIDAEIAERRPVCRMSGRCCHFDTHGHCLYVTALEIAWVIAQRPPSSLAGLDARDEHLDGCIFQVERLCTVHAIRPLGCRVYFCDPAAQAWQNDLYERHLADLRALHDEHRIAYRYLEWRAGLAEALEAQR